MLLFVEREKKADPKTTARPATIARIGGEFVFHSDGAGKNWTRGLKVEFAAAILEMVNRVRRERHFAFKCV